MKKLDILYLVFFLTFLTSFFVPAYMLPDGPIIGYRCSWVPLTGVTNGSPEAILGTLANFIVWGVVFFGRIVKRRFYMVALTSLTMISTLSWLVLVEEFSTENLLIGYWLWAFSSPVIIYLQFKRVRQQLAS